MYSKTRILKIGLMSPSMANLLMEQNLTQKLCESLKDTEPAENGSILSRMYVITAQMELDKIAQNELAYLISIPIARSSHPS